MNWWCGLHHPGWGAVAWAYSVYSRRTFWDPANAQACEEGAGQGGVLGGGWRSWVSQIYQAKSF